MDMGGAHLVPLGLGAHRFGRRRVRARRRNGRADRRRWSHEVAWIRVRGTRRGGRTLGIKAALLARRVLHNAVGVAATKAIRDCINPLGVVVR